MAKLLIVEDSEMLCGIFETLLDKYTNFDYDIVNTYAQTEALIKSQRYEFCVADMNLPDAKHGEVISLLNKYNISPIVFTGIFDEDFRDGFESANIVDYILKERYDNIIFVVEKLKQLEENKKKSILIVDDSHTYLRYLKQNLQLHYFKIFTAANGQEALRLLDDHPEIELMITDYHMPIMDGLLLVRKVRKKTSRKDLSIIVLTSETNSYTTSRFLKEGANDYITKPFSRDEFYARIYQNISTTDLFQSIETDFDDDIIALLSEVAEFRHSEASSHVLRIKEYTYILAKLCGVFEDESKMISKMALLHDMGKISTPDHILCKQGKLTENEFEIMKQHTINGKELIAMAFGKNPKMGTVAQEIALYHHENWDGSGYPEGLAGKDIPIHARIVSLVDVFDALMHKRVYKDAWELDEALKYIQEQSGAKFEPELVKLFMLNIDSFLDVMSRYKDATSQFEYCEV